MQEKLKIAIGGGKPEFKKSEFVVFGQPLILQDEINEVSACLSRRWIGTGPLVNKFEESFSKYLDVPYVAAVNSCTSALHLALIALKIGKGDEVITTPLTFCATVNSILYVGAKPILADIDPETLNISPSAIEKAITSRTKAIIPVHFAGRPCQMKEIMRIARKNNLKVIEDCAHAIESKYENKHLGTIGDIGCFSFYATKSITTGEGGMVVTKDKSIISKIKTLSLHGLSRNAWERFSRAGFSHYQVVDLGYKYNMTDLAAAIGIHQLKRINKNWIKRKLIWNLYMKELSGLPLKLPCPPERNQLHSYHLFTPLLELNKLRYGRDWIMKAIQSENIGSGVHYIPLHWHPYYRKTIKFRTKDLPNSNMVGERTFSLPISGAMSVSQAVKVARALKRILEYASK
jgi:dTDP-4-amino-4,6-dideoxygalactose transaminase